MTRLLHALADHVRGRWVALCEHVDAAWDCWGDDK